MKAGGRSLIVLAAARVLLLTGWVAPAAAVPFTDADWLPMGTGVSGGWSFVTALAVSGNTVYAGGFFTSAGGIPATNIAQWNGTSWSALGTGISGPVYALAVSGSNLYAGGNFTNAGGVPANCVAQWNGSNWSALASGVSGEDAHGDGPAVFALAVLGSNLYAGGLFTMAGRSPALYIAQWNGSSWSGVNAGVDGEVYALAVSGSTLYVGGLITGASGGGVTQWNGSNWSVPGSGTTPGRVYALATSGNMLYAGGEFTNAGGIPAADVAEWNGTNWAPLGSGIEPGWSTSVAALAVSGSTVYVGGSFNNAGGIPATNIAQWNGASWSPLGSGVGGGINALAVSGGTLYAGGEFGFAGTNRACGVAQAELPVCVTIISSNADFGFTNGLFGFDVSGPVGSNVVIQVSADLENWCAVQTNLLTNGLAYFSDPTSGTNNIQQFYRAVLP
jgi:hypothetical protein